MSSKNLQNVRQIYTSLLTEAKLRIEEIGFRISVIDSDPDSETAFMEAEFAYLQTRLLCEVTALSTLVLHLNDEIRPKLLKEWSADKIFYELKKINPHCFPIPIRSEREDSGEMHFSQLKVHICRLEISRKYTINAEKFCIVA